MADLQPGVHEIGAELQLVRAQDRPQVVAPPPACAISDEHPFTCK